MTNPASGFDSVIDRFSIATGQLVSWLTLFMVVVTFVIVILRYLFDIGFIWLQVHWVRRAVREYQQFSLAERLQRHARHFRDHHAKPAIAEMQRHWKEWRWNR